MYQKNDGWFRENKKEQVFGKTVFRLPELYTDEYMTSDTHKKFNWPVDLINGQKQKTVGKEKDEQIEERSPSEPEEVSLTVKVKDLTSWRSYAAFHQNRNVFEDRIRQKTYSTKKFSEVVNRFRLVYLGIEKIKYVQKFVFYQDFPKFSKFMRIILLLIAYFANAQSLSSYYILLLIFTMVCYSPPWRKFVTPNINSFFF